MDPLTHFLSGVLASRAGFRRWCAQAHWVAPVAAMAPDGDALAGLWGSEIYLAWHRQWTHSLAAAPLVAVAALLPAAMRFRGRLAWGRSYLVALAAVLLHDGLDLSNAYGVRLLLPFSERWLRLDLFYIVDLWIWGLLLLAVLGPMLSRLVSREIGARDGGGRSAAVAAFVWLALYGGARWVMHERAVAVLEARLYEGRTPLRAAALPSPANPFRWRGLVETENFYAVAEVDLTGEFDPTTARILHKSGSTPEQAAAARAARSSRAFQIFLDFSQYPLWRFVPLDQPEGGVRVEAMDLRFGEPAAPRFVATAVVTAEGRVLRAWYRF